MAEFKVDKALNGEISALKASGNLINDGYSKVSSDNVSTLKTSMSIISQHSSIKALLDLYKALVSRDVSDLEALVKEAEEMDAAISSSQKT